MKEPMTISLCDSITLKQVRSVILFALILGILFSALQIYLDYHEQKEKLDRTVLQAINVTKQAAVNAAFFLDRHLAEEIATGLFEYRPIVEVRISDNFGKVLNFCTCRASEQVHECLTDRLLLGKEKAYIIPLFKNNSGPERIGKMTVYADPRYFISSFCYRAASTISHTLIHNIVLGIVIFFLFYKMTTKPLFLVARSMAEVDPGELQKRMLSVPRGHEKDEVGLLVSSGNRMLQAIGNYLGKIRQAEEELRKYRDHLEQLVDTRTAELREEIAERKQTEKALQKARNAAESASQAKSRFLANVSHEFRTPLNAILGFARLTEQEPDLPTACKKNMEIIIRSGERLLDLLNEVLEVSGIETGQHVLTPADFDLCHMLGSLEDMMRDRAEKKGLELVFEVSPDVPRHVRTDKHKLRRVLMGLLDNAVKFTERGRVVLRVERNLSPSVKALRFEVKDTGPGIAPEEKESLFEIFTRTKSGLSPPEGTGPGLAVCQGFVRLMGGQLVFDSQADRGTVFTFGIGVEPAESPPIRDRPPAVLGLEPGQTDWRILVVDDNAENRRLLCLLLERAGFTVQEAVTGKEAVTLCEQWDPHLVWMDMRMPVMDGYEAAKRIRASIDRPPPIIALTASDFEDDQHTVLKAGFDGFIRKPFRTPEVFDAMQKHLGVRYRYEGDEPRHTRDRQEPSEHFMPSVALADLPLPLMEELEHAVLLSRMEQIDFLIGQIRKHDTGLGDLLGRLSAVFDYKEMLRLIQNAKEEGDEQSSET